ncbi:MAG: hypothetical protein L6Q98_04905 [Anaerolineae bacterium]|nr:hypothetical protein [Anaerolineae bacterium]
MSDLWRRAAAYGIAIAFLHRLALTVWMALAWAFLSSYLPEARADFHATTDAHLPALASPAEAHLLGVWRRWDAVHYLDLTVNGYRLDQAGSTVFGVLTPLALRAASLVTGGSADIASILVQTTAFAAALTLLYVFGARYYQDEALGRAAALTTALLPLSFYFAAPLSESLYLTFSLGVLLLSLNGRWLAAGLTGFLAALTRTQGVILAAAAGVMLLDQVGFDWRAPSTWLRAASRSLRRGWALALIPAGALVFIAYRAALGLPPLGDTYAHYSYHFFVNPLEGLWINLRWIAAHPAEAVISLDVWVMIASFAGLILALRFPQHRRLPLIAFTLGHLLVYVSKINWVWGTTDQPLYSQSFARYAVVLFPLILLIADGARRLPALPRIALGAVSGLLLLFAGALFTVALVGP